MADQKMLTDWEDGHGDNVTCDEEEQTMTSQGMMTAMWWRRWQYGEKKKKKMMMMITGLIEENNDNDDDGWSYSQSLSWFSGQNNQHIFLPDSTLISSLQLGGQYYTIPHVHS
jgi:hypothetical protein